MSSPADSPNRRLRRLALLAALAQLLLVAGGLRHHLVWGESAAMPWLLPLLATFEAGCLVGAVALGGLAWWRAADLAARDRPGLRALLRASLPILVAAVLVPPFLSADVVDYVVRGRVLVLHGGNPYVQVASDYPADPFLHFGDRAWKDFPLPYGPIVAHLQGLVAGLAHALAGVGLSARAELILAIVLFKLVFAAAFALAAVFTRTLAARLRPGTEDRAFVAVLWNPLLLLELVANAHNDALVVLLVTVAVLATLASRFGAAALGLGLGVLTKVVPAVLAPLLLAAAVRRRRVGALLLGAAGTAALGALFWLQFFCEPGALDFVRRQSELAGASPVWAVSALGLLSPAAALTAGRVVVVAVAALALLRWWRTRTDGDLVLAAALPLAALACFGLAIFGPWYHAWWLPLAFALGRGRIHRLAVAVTLLAPLGYVVWAGPRRLDEPHQIVMLAMAVVLPALCALWRPRRRSAAPAGG